MSKKIIKGQSTLALYLKIHFIRCKNHLQNVIKKCTIICYVVLVFSLQYFRESFSPDLIILLLSVATSSVWVCLYIYVCVFVCVCVCVCACVCTLVCSFLSLGYGFFGVHCFHESMLTTVLYGVRSHHLFWFATGINNCSHSFYNIF